MSKNAPYIAQGPTGADDFQKVRVDGSGRLRTVVEGSVSGSLSPAGLESGLKNSVQTITDTPSKIGQLVNRNTLSVRIWGAPTVYFGTQAGLTSSNGYPKKQFEELSIDLQDDAPVELWAVCAAGESCEVRVIEAG